MKNLDRKVFLGGTCNGSTWRDELIPMLRIDYFNPVVEDWTAACQDEEIRQREISNHCLYVITPLMTGVYSIAEAVDDSHRPRPHTTIFCVLENEGDQSFSVANMKSLDMTSKLIVKNGGFYFKSLQEVADFLNDGL